MHRGWYGKFIEPNFVVENGYLMAPKEPGLGARLKTGVKRRKDAVVRTSSERREPWLTSRKRYTYPPEDIQQEFEKARK
jgi:hypothetical protein